MNSESEVLSRLFENQDLEYRDFHSKLMPTVNKNRIIGVRTPVLRKIAKEFNKSDYKKDFLPYFYYSDVFSDFKKQNDLEM